MIKYKRVSKLFSTFLTSMLLNIHVHLNFYLFYSSSQQPAKDISSQEPAKEEHC